MPLMVVSLPLKQKTPTWRNAHNSSTFEYNSQKKVGAVVFHAAFHEKVPHIVFGAVKQRLRDHIFTVPVLSTERSDDIHAHDHERYAQFLVSLQQVTIETRLIESHVRLLDGTSNSNMCLACAQVPTQQN